MACSAEDVFSEPVIVRSIQDVSVDLIDRYNSLTSCATRSLTGFLCFTPRNNIDRACRLRTAFFSLLCLFRFFAIFGLL
jgi:hypothetical protein